MIGAEFTGVLHAAQQGRVDAFLRLWTDVQPALTRYLRVVAVADADDIATESWVAVVRRLRAFEGDETAWRELVFSAARMHAEDENQRRVWDAMVEDEGVTSVVAAPLPLGEEPFEEDELEGGPAHGLRLTIEALRDLPPAQGEVLMLRWMAGLPEEVVASLVDVEPQAVHTLEQQALDQLGLDAELLAWALGAEPRPVELADEAVVAGVYRAAVPEPAPTPSQLPEGRSPNGARVIALRPPTWRARAGAAAVASAAVLGLGAFSAAAYQGVLPDPVQNVMHVVIGAPEATPKASTSTAAARKKTAAPRTNAAQGPGASSPRPEAVTTSTSAVQLPRRAALGLCRAWETQREHGVTQDRSTAFRKLAKAAGGDFRVGAYCAATGVPLAPITNTPATSGPMTKTPDKPTGPTKSVTPNKPTKPDKSTPPGKTTSTPPGKTTSTPPNPTTTSVPPPTTTSAPPATGGAGGSDGGGSNQGGGTQGAGKSTEAPGAAKGQEQGAG